MAAIYERIGEPCDMPGCFPYLRMHEDRRVEPLDVVAGVNHRIPPAVLDVSLQRHAEGTVVPD
jgi:hypothetical protein